MIALITEQDLLSAIAECQGERDPNANTCIKLAAYYTIYNQLFGKELVGNANKLPEQVNQQYSALPAQPIDPPIIQYNSDTEFAQAVNGMPVNVVLSVFDDLMSTLWALYPRLYRDVMQSIQ